MDWFSRENFNRKTPYFMGEIDGFRLRFSLENQSFEYFVWRGPYVLGIIILE
jgi:hypothetical protein